MSFCFFKQRPKSAPELVKGIRDSLLALDTKTVVECKALEKALEEVEKNFVAMRQMLSGDVEAEPNADNVSQFTLEICKEDVIGLFVHMLPILGWEARKDLVHCWSILLRQIVGSSHCCVDYIENHLELLDFLVVSYINKENCLELWKHVEGVHQIPDPCKYVELPNFDVSVDAFVTFKDLLTKHQTAVSEFLTARYEEFFELYEKLLTSPNYVTRRHSLKIASFRISFGTSKFPYYEVVHWRSSVLESHDDLAQHIVKDSSKNIKISASHIFKIFVANPNKPQEIIIILTKNHERLLEMLHNLSVGKGSEDEQFEEQKDLVIKEIERISHIPTVAC